MVQDFELKAQIIECALDWVVSEVEKAINHHIRWERNPDYIPKFPSAFSYEEAIAIKQEYNATPKGRKFWHEAEKINHAKNARTTRLRRRIAEYLKKPCVFLTLTFRDDVFETTTRETRRTYVARSLKGLAVPYVANYDTGEEYGREHYHAIAQIERVDFSFWQYGNLDAEAVTRPHPKRMARYIAKLTNHAIKDTAQGNRILYSR